MNQQYLGESDAQPELTDFSEKPFASTQSSPSVLDGDAQMNVDPLNWPRHIPHTLQSTTTPLASSGIGMPISKKTGVLPLQKRRRVTRACDECRRKKIKCDGKQPCTHCSVYSYECTYDQPSSRRRNPAPHYIETLEKRLQRADAVLKAILPDVDIYSPFFDISKIPQDVRKTAAESIAQPSPALRSDQPPDQDPLLDSMVKATGRLVIDASGHLDYHGHSSGLLYLNQLNDQSGGLLCEIKYSWPASTKQNPLSPLSHTPNGENLPDVSLLPLRENAKILVDICLDCACALMRFIHRPSFVRMMERIYDIKPEEYEEDENTFLPLFYMALSVGCLFSNDADAQSIGIYDTTHEGMKFFNAGRRMIEMTDIRDIYSLQAILFMTVYLQSSTPVAAGYSYICIALAASVRMGLHRQIPETRFDPIEREVRKRVFWTSWKMSTYVSTILGLPQGIGLEDIDQEMPAEVDDEYITKDSISLQPEGVVSMMTVANAYTRLLKIMAKTVRYIYPFKAVVASVDGKGAGHSVSYSYLREIEQDLAMWLDSLPMILRPGGDTPTQFFRAQYLLKMAFSHVQLMLYRPFVHHISKPKSKGGDERCYSIAASCVNVARKIVHTIDEMRKSGYLNEAYWFPIYTAFFSIIILIYYVNSNDPPNATSLAILRDAMIGKDCMWTIKDKSIAARRCTAVLTPLFERISKKFGDKLNASPPQKKRTRELSQTRMTGHQPSLLMADTQVSSSTVSPDTSVVTTPDNRSKASPTTPTAEYEQVSSPSPTRMCEKFSCKPDLMGRRKSYGVYPELASNLKPTVINQRFLSRNSMPDMNSSIFGSSQDPFNYIPHSLDAYEVLDHQNTEMVSPSIDTISAIDPFANIEETLLGPFPSYPLQGPPQHQQILDNSANILPTNSSERPYSRNNIQGHPSGIDGNVCGGDGDLDALERYFADHGAGLGSGSEAMEFLKDEWDDALIHQAFIQRNST